MIENGFVRLPEAAAWLAPYLAELATSPNGKHDDQVDPTAQMLDWFKGAAREPGFLELLLNARANARYGDSLRDFRTRVPGRVR
jgi:hypothetical protein